MTVDQSNKRSFYATDLGWIPDARATLVIGEEISKNRNVLCATRVDYTFREALVWVDETRWSRWRSATERLFAKIRALQDEERAASLQWYPPFINPLLWRIVNLWRIWWLRKTYEDKMAKLRADFNAALAEYQKQTEDLPQYVREYMRQLIEREALRLQQERERRAQRAAAVAIAARAVWSYRLETDRDNRRSLSIYLPTSTRRRARAHARGSPLGKSRTRWTPNVRNTPTHPSAGAATPNWLSRRRTGRPRQAGAPSPAR